MNPKLLILGHGRHGKDTVADIIVENFGFTKTSSSMFAAEHVVQPWLEANRGLTYRNIEACYEDRANHRQDWYEAISQYNQDDPARLASEVLEVSDIYVGMRDDREFYAARGMFDYVIGVTAFDRVKALDPTFLVPLSECDFILTNDGDEDDLENDTIVLVESRILV